MNLRVQYVTAQNVLHKSIHMIEPCTFEKSLKLFTFYDNYFIRSVEQPISPTSDQSTECQQFSLAQFQCKTFFTWLELIWRGYVKDLYWYHSSE